MLKRLPPKPPKQMDGYTPRPRSAAVAVAGPARAILSLPKKPPVRDTRLRDMCRGMACQHCGMAGERAGVSWAHSNQSKHGKAGAMKASDVYVAALCWVCHTRLDQGKDWTQEEKVAMWNAAHAKTVALALKRGTWPDGINVPGAT